MLIMSILIFIVWLILNAKVTLEVTLFGIGVIIIVWALIINLVPKEHRHRFPISKLFKTLEYVVIVFWEVVKANLDMINIVLFVDESELTPSYTKVKIDLENPLAKTALTSSITLTPGTITVAVTGDEYYIHALDKSMLEGTHESIFVEKLKELEE